MADATVSAAGMRIVRLLVGNPPESINDLAEKLNVTRTAITDPLNELLAAGFVERTKAPVVDGEGPGRPRYLYRATVAALCLLFVGNQHMVVPAIWEVLEQIGGPKLSAKVLRQLTLKLVERYREKITAADPEGRLKQLAATLRNEGGLVEVQTTGGQLVLRKRSCAFVSMFEPTGKVCQIDESLITELVGAPVRRIACRHDGDPCCSFELVPPSES